MKKKNNLITIFAVVFGAFILTGCPPKKKLEVEDQSKEEPTQEAAATDENAETDAANKIQITQDWTEIPALTVAYFDYDSAKIDLTQRDALKKNVAIIKKLPPTVVVRVEGHCDDRGTVEYNIALGQRRADSVRSFYKAAGLKESRLQTISFGEERPSCTDETESCWSKNRRGVTKVKNAQPITVQANELE